MTQWFKLLDYGLIEIKGQDGARFLQGQLSVNVLKLTEGQTSLAAHCNPQGRIMSLGWLTLHQANYYFLLPRDMVTSAINALKKYAIFFKISIEDITDHYFFVGQLSEEAPSYSFSFNLARGSYLSIIANTSPLEMTMDLNYHWKAYLIQCGIPAIYPRTSAQLLPHEINLPELKGIDFDKGCYTGQEIIARMHYRGKLKTHLYRMTCSTSRSLVPGMELHVMRGQKKGGIIVDSAPFSATKQICLVVTQQEAIDQGLCLSDHHPILPFTLL